MHCLKQDEIDFLWGSATASYQCEGAWNEDGRGLSIWDDFSHNSELNVNHVDGDVASDHYHRFREDLSMLKEGGQNSYRFSISWTRIIPDSSGEVNQAGIDYYNKMIDCMEELGIVPFVTLYHWDLPLHLANNGGWENEQTAYEFAKYCDICFSCFGDRVKHWVTMNEPHYSIFSMYGSGNYPPNVKDGNRLIKAAYYTMLGSALAVKKFRNYSNIGIIGLVHDIHPCYSKEDSPECHKATEMADLIFNGWVLDTCINGEIPPTLIENLNKLYDLTYMESEKHQRELSDGKVDFIGLNYYSRGLISPYIDGETSLKCNNLGKRTAIDEPLAIIKPFFTEVKDPDGEFTDWDMEIYPNGMKESIINTYSRYHVPVYITENGIGAYEDIPEDKIICDDYRIDFLNKHINSMNEAIRDGADVRGYFVWSTFDLYSWVNGYKKRYGLVAIDFDDISLPRHPKKSYYWYKEKIKEARDHDIKK
ncbi:MAG: glycoside hydrolase family 1 protein [Erysipelotrichia bacterium]|nr:glycoside hydrolase family 1 protein [Erysipelotrichia bacterium]